jgi:hypothetical protein
MKTFQISTKSNLFLLISSIPVTLIRHKIQYGEYFTESVFSFLSSLAIHFFGLYIVAVASFHLFSALKQRIFKSEDSDSLELCVFYAGCFGIITSISIIFLSNWPISTDQL